MENFKKRKRIAEEKPGPIITQKRDGDDGRPIFGSFLSKMPSLGSFSLKFPYFGESLSTNYYNMHYLYDAA